MQIFYYPCMSSRNQLRNFCHKQITKERKKNISMTKRTSLQFVVLMLYFSAPFWQSSEAEVPDSTVRIRFLVTVNDTWDPKGCMETVATPFLVSGKKYNRSQSIQVGNCDHGPLVFTVQQGASDGVSKMNVFLTFHSSVIEDASPPTCNIPWNGTYLNPTEEKMDRSPLPSCYTAESREGYHMTYYWFRLLEWTFY